AGADEELGDGAILRRAEVPAWWPGAVPRGRVPQVPALPIWAGALELVTGTGNGLPDGRQWSTTR
ncbi:hypothetical protein, partial [Nocardia cyriacigeorgica]|uniref:hypothetical protein n=1 Tax=Nocardia cyriacigeorgica TaxID=135487 RepID=UPI001E3A7E74